MATGALDVNNIWQYGEDDALASPDWSGYMNKGMASVSSALTGSAWTALATTNVTSVVCSYRKIGNVVYFKAEFYNVVAGTMCTIPAGFRVSSRLQALALRASSTGSLTIAASLLFNTDGTVVVSLAAGATLTASPGYTVNLSWPV